jgi:hypothetical protein
VALVWAPTVTRTSTVPLPAGLVALQLVVVEQETLLAGLAPNATVVAPGDVLNPVPLIVTVVPPAVEPLLGTIALTVGAAMYVKQPAQVPDCASVFVTVTLTEPAACAGVVAVIDAAFTTTTLVAALPPIVTVAPAPKPVPVIVTAVPPAAGPLVGAMPVTVGAAA